MKHQTDQYTIQFNDMKNPDLREFVAGQSFRLDGHSISNELLISLTRRMTDLLRIAASVS